MRKVQQYRDLFRLLNGRYPKPEETLSYFGVRKMPVVEPAQPAETPQPLRLYRPVGEKLPQPT